MTSIETVTIEWQAKYLPAIGRNPGEEKNVTHYYLYESDYYQPMCPYGWNRANGFSFSILRNNYGRRNCKLCLKNIKAGKPPVEPKFRKTQWI